MEEDKITDVKTEETVGENSGSSSNDDTKKNGIRLILGYAIGLLIMLIGALILKYI